MSNSVDEAKEAAKSQQDELERFWLYPAGTPPGSHEERFKTGVMPGREREMRIIQTLTAQQQRIKALEEQLVCLRDCHEQILYNPHQDAQSIAVKALNEVNRLARENT